MSRLAFVLTCLVASSAWADKSAVAVLDIQGTGVDPSLLPTLTEVLTVEINDLGMYKVVAGRDVQAMLGFEKQKDMLGCTDAACLAEIGGALGVDRIVVSQIGKVGNTYVVNIKIINIRMADTEGRVYETVKGEVDALIDTIKKSAFKLLGSGSKAAATVTGAKPTEKPAVRPAEPKPAEEKHAGHSAEAHAVATPQATEPTPQVEAKVASGGVGWLPITLWGVGGVGVVAGTIFGLNARGNANDANQLAPGSTDSNPIYAAGTQAKAARAENQALLANVFFGVGIVSAGAGVLVWLLSDAKGGEPTAALAPIYTGDAVGLGFSTPF